MLTFVSDFANSTLQNKFLVIIDQQKVRFILIFAANFEKKLLYRAKSQRKPTETYSAIWKYSTFAPDFAKSDFTK